ncbi:MAG TPA: PIN domain-containing protein [Rugosimonospora sp.]|nr:PIN domain-containing protein [Rugosimonospora sp.]
MTERVDAAGTIGSSNRDQMLGVYLAWVRTTELQYRNLFADGEMLISLHSPRHWHIRAHGRGEDLLVGPAVFGEELETQRHQIAATIESLKELVHLVERAGDVLVLDTNTMLHYRPLDEIIWCDETGSSVIRLLIPLVVLDELDNKTYASSKQLAGRAETRLRLLDRHLEQAVTGGSEIRSGVTVEILSDPMGHQRNPDVDHEILNRAELVSQVIEKKVVVISGDRGMRVRGISRGMAVKPLSERWRLPLGEAE